MASRSRIGRICMHTIVNVPTPGDFKTDIEVQANSRQLSEMEPRIEPETVFGLRDVPQAGMNGVEILGYLVWIAQGFEVVTSIFPHWRFTADDTTAVFALHIVTQGAKTTFARSG